MKLIKNVLASNHFKEIWNKASGLYLLSLISCGLVLEFVPSKVFKILALFFAFITQGVYSWFTRPKDGNIGIGEVQKGMLLGILFMLLVTYIAVSTYEIKIAIISVIILVVLMMALPIISNMHNLINSKNLFGLAINYLFFSIGIIILFSLFFAITNGLPESGIVYNSATPVNKTIDFIYYSAQVYHSTTFGDITPLGYSRLISFIELLISFIVHIIIIGYVINRIVNSKSVKEEAKEVMNK